METQQPDWEYVANLGDMNIADYGGFLVFRDKTGVYPPEAEVYEPEEGERGGLTYRFPLDPPRFKTLTEAGKRQGYSSRELPATDRGVTWHWYREWFARPDKLKSAASTSGLAPFTLLRMLASRDPETRADGYQIVVGNFGCFEFDQSPLVLSEDEAQKRYAKYTRSFQEAAR